MRPRTVKGMLREAKLSGDLQEMTCKAHQVSSYLQLDTGMYVEGMLIKTLSLNGVR